MGPPNEVLPLIADGTHTAIELAEIFGLEAIAESVMVGAGVVGVVGGPFFMWYEAIQANSAGELTAYRWSVYRPWMDGYLAGLYGGSPGEVDHLFVAVRDYGYHAAADKRAALALLVFASGRMGFTDEPDQLSASDWALSHQSQGWTYRGLENVISGRDS